MMRILGFILIHLAAVSSNLTTTNINYTSTADMDENEEQNAVDAEAMEKSLDLETRYKQLSKTLSQINGDENHEIFDRSSASHHMHRHKSHNFSRWESKDGENMVEEGSGLMPHISDDDDYSIPELEGSGSPSPSSYSHDDNVDLDFSNENHLVDMLSKKFDFDKDIGLEEISSISPESQPVTVTMATLADTSTSVAAESTTISLSTNNSISEAPPSTQPTRLSSKFTGHMTRLPSKVSHVTSTSMRTTQNLVRKVESTNKLEKGYNKNRAENYKMGQKNLLTILALVFLSIVWRIT